MIGHGSEAISAGGKTEKPTTLIPVEATWKYPNDGSDPCTSCYFRHVFTVDEPAACPRRWSCTRRPPALATTCNSLSDVTDTS
jgi:hypothetical protein